MSVPALIQFADQLWTIASNNPDRIAAGLGYLALTAHIAPPIFRKIAFAFQLGYVALQERPSEAIRLLCSADDHTQGKLEITDTNVKLLGERLKLAKEFRRILKRAKELERDREDLRKVEQWKGKDQRQSPVVQRVLQEKSETSGKLNTEKLAKALQEKIKSERPDLKSQREINDYVGNYLEGKKVSTVNINKVLGHLQKLAGAPAA